MDSKKRVFIFNELSKILNRLEKDLFKFRNGDMSINKLYLLFKAEFVNIKRRFYRYLPPEGKNPGPAEH